VNTYSVEQFAAKYIAGKGIADKDPVRWVKSRIKRGDIRAKKVARGKWILTDAHIEAWLAADPVPTTETPQPEPVSDDVVTPIVGGLSQRSQGRIRNRAVSA
jgi:hypothetical protein